MTTDIIERSRLIFTLINQGELWLPDGKPAVRIADMDPSWRYNAAAYLVRRASSYAVHYGFGEIRAIWGATARSVIPDDNGQPMEGPMVSLAPSEGSMAADALERELEAADEARMKDPESWLKTTTLYQALIKDLPDGIAELAKHWSDCAIRNDGGVCTCRERHVAECPKRDNIDNPCHCRDHSPEWTR